jgi:pimeloyl-ACP methyl ester carboxylesterase
MDTRRWLVASTALVFAVAVVRLLVDQAAGIGAGALLHPARRDGSIATPSSCIDQVFEGLDTKLVGWWCRAQGVRRGTIVYLHGVADNRASAVGVIQRFVPLGFDVIAYDSRAHGLSDGEFCTYGFHEKEDLRRVIDVVEPGPMVLIGTSLGAAVALQQAALDPRVAAVVAAETFSDLRTIASERAPFFFTPALINRAFALAERQGGFKVDEVSPVRAAEAISVPVLLVHGAADVETVPAHSERVLAALGGPKQLMIVAGAGHNGSLQHSVWTAIQQWLDAVVPSAMFHVRHTVVTPSYAPRY